MTNYRGAAVQTCTGGGDVFGVRQGHGGWGTQGMGTSRGV